MGSEEKRYALLIDSDNVSAKYIDTIFDELADRGMVTVRRIYGDWARSVNGWNRATLLRNSIVPIQQFAYTQGKNATDSAMIIDAMICSILEIWMDSAWCRVTVILPGWQSVCERLVRK